MLLILWDAWPSLDSGLPNRGHTFQKLDRVFSSNNPLLLSQGWTSCSHPFWNSSWSCASCHNDCEHTVQLPICVQSTVSLQSSPTIASTFFLTPCSPWFRAIGGEICIDVSYRWAFWSFLVSISVSIVGSELVNIYWNKKLFLMKVDTCVFVCMYIHTYVYIF